jgi:hypothetical protein
MYASTILSEELSQAICSHTEDESDICLQNIHNHAQDYTAYMQKITVLMKVSELICINMNIYKCFFFKGGMCSTWPAGHFLSALRKIF